MSYLYILFIFILLFLKSNGNYNTLISNQSLESDIHHALRKLPVSKYSRIIFPYENDFKDYVITANFACSTICPIAIVVPQNIKDISIIVKFVYNRIKTHKDIVIISTKGGGHGYTCQSLSFNSILIDLRQFKSIELFDKHENQNNPYIKLGAGLNFKEVLKYLNKHNKYLTLIHGQCTEVGITGFTLHGGVHFGALSEFFGLGCDNIKSLTMISANGSIVELNTNNCSIDSITGDLDACNDLFTSMSGAGSSFGIVVSMSLNLHHISNLSTALSVLTVNASNSTIAANAIISYLNSFSPSVSVTLFGLDAFFKAYLFVAKFAENSINSLIVNDLRNVFNDLCRLDRKTNVKIHFVVEIGWISGNMSSYNNLTTNITQIQSNMQSWLSTFESKEVLTIREWILTSSTWSVPSYDLVWGFGHSYGAASISVDEDNTYIALATALIDYKQHIQIGYCSDCVFVIHKVINGIRGYQTQSSNSFNPFRVNVSLWIELDCGHFHSQRHSWSNCSEYIDDIQRNLDSSIPNGHRLHYPNVPNLVTKDWESQYYGDEGFSRLQLTKDVWDPFNIFSTRQGVYPTSSSNSELHDRSSSYSLLTATGRASACYPSNIVRYKILSAVKGGLLTIFNCFKRILSRIFKLN